MQREYREVGPLVEMDFIGEAEQEVQQLSRLFLPPDVYMIEAVRVDARTIRLRQVLKPQYLNAPAAQPAIAAPAELAVAVTAPFEPTEPPAPQKPAEPSISLAVLAELEKLEKPALVTIAGEMQIETKGKSKTDLVVEIAKAKSK